MDVNAWVPLVVTSLASIAASSGFWAYMSKRNDNKSQTDRLLRGLAYDKLMTQGMVYIQRGWLTKDEYEEYRRYLYDPYKALGGNGVAERVMIEVSNLPLKPSHAFVEVVHEARSRRDSNGN